MEDTEKDTQPDILPITQLSAQPQDGMAQHGTVDEAFQSIQSALIEAAKSGQFMVAVWSHERSEHSSKIRLITRTTWQFPVSEYATAIDMLRSDTNKDAARISDAIRPGPLELASLVNHARREAQAAQAIQQADESQPIPTDDSHAH